MAYTVTNSLGTKTYLQEDDAYDYALKVIKQTGLVSTITEEQ